MLAATARVALSLSRWYPLEAAGLFAAIMLIAIGFLRDRHPFDRFGPANFVTTVRALLVALVAGLVAEPAAAPIAASAAAAAFVATMLDGVDGWLARRSGMASRFGARFDLEMDALLVLVLAALTWRHGKAGSWVLLTGLLRYVFVAAGWWWSWLQEPLPPSRRRQAICVVQVVGLGLAVVPAVTLPWSTLVAGVALATLGYSFLVDVAWLARRAGERRHWVAVVAALAILNASLAFRNVWPTPGVSWRGELSVEFAVVVLVMAASRRWSAAPSRTLLRCLAAVWVLLVLGRYAEVTAPALYGRAINLYWDSRHVSAVTQMLGSVAPWWLVALVLAALVLIPLGAYALMRWALGCVSDALSRPRVRRAVEALAAVIVALFIAQRVDERLPASAVLSAPITQTYWRQARLVIGGVTGRNARLLGPSPSLDADLGRLGGADVLLVFMESYGAVTYDRPDFSQPLASARARFEDEVRASGREMVSAFVESPTFGGNSWLAHVSLLSGIEVRDEDANMQLMAQKRESLVTAFGRRGYRTVAVMPGLQQSWPEGRFYGFDDIYGWARLNYQGPSFGWWEVPDQFTIARLDALEVAPRTRAPLFAFFPTISTHTPFSPTAPYQPDWARVLTDEPFDEADVKRSWLDVPDWMDLGPSYVRAVTYSYASLGGYLRMRADRDLIMVLIGDHQPPAAVSGEQASWDVPVHVVASRKDVLDALLTHGFRRGVGPGRTTLTRMHALTPLLLDAFSAHRTPGPSAATSVAAASLSR